MTEENKEIRDTVVGDEMLREQEADLSEQFLGKALRHSFVILKIIMAVLVVLFITSGIFRVEENENALVLQFGKIREFRSGKTGQMEKVLTPGLKWAWPEPISEIIRIPVTDVRSLAINSFWYFQTEQEKLQKTRRYAGPTLDPRRDGYCLTRNDNVGGEGEMDYNIVHADFQLTYRISDIEDFFRNVYYKTPRPGEDFLDVASESVDPLLRMIASDAIVTTMVNYSIDEAIVNDSRIAKDVERKVKSRLEQLHSGIAIDNLLVTRITWPTQVDAEFQAANKASQQSQQAIIDAKSYAGKTLSEAGGANGEVVLGQLKSVLIALGELGTGDSHRDEYESQRDYLLSQLTGASREKIADARAYKTKVVETARANADYLKAMLPEYRIRPELVVKTIYQEAVEEILGGADEKILVQPGKGDKPRDIRILINRNPRIKQKEADKKAAEQR
jgi:regulator of protease activity HflC (stomatin/prohibitin superfamily)